MSGAVARIGRLVGVETTKISGGRLAWFGLVAVALATVVTGLVTDAAGATTGWSSASHAFGTGLWAAEILVLVAATTAIAGETDRGTLKMILPHAYRRSDWIFAKGIAVVGFALVLLLVAALGALGVGFFSGGLGDVTQKYEAGFGDAGRVEVLHSAGAMAGRFGSAVAVAGASLFATAMLGLFVSCAFDAVIPALSTGFLLFMGLKSAGTLFGVSPEALGHVYSSHAGSMLDLLDKLGRGFGYAWDEKQLPRGLVQSAAVSAVALVGSLAVFTRRDLKA